jgi:acetyl-CoA carboxylase carboxyltransferase component
MPDLKSLPVWLTRARERIARLVDAGSFTETGGLVAAWRQIHDDAELRELGIREERRYARRLGSELARLRGRTLGDVANPA